MLASYGLPGGLGSPTPTSVLTMPISAWPIRFDVRSQEFKIGGFSKEFVVDNISVVSRVEDRATQS